MGSTWAASESANESTVFVSRTASRCKSKALTWHRPPSGSESPTIAMSDQTTNLAPTVTALRKSSRLKLPTWLFVRSRSRFRRAFLTSSSDCVRRDFSKCNALETASDT